MDREAQMYYENKEFSRAIALWINIFSIDPENDAVKKKIEIVYEIKSRKDFSFWKSKLNYKIARKILSINQKSEDLSLEKAAKNLKRCKVKANASIEDFKIAYKIDPHDPEVKQHKEDLIRLIEDIKAEEEKARLSNELLERSRRLKALAKKEMKLGQYENALKHWEEILSFLPTDNDAKEGQRECKLAIADRLKYERIRQLMNSGKELYGKKQYKFSKLDFIQVLKIDPKNREAKEYISLIEEKLEGKRLYEAALAQAEESYQSGINNLKKNKFDTARQDLETCLALIPNYKDAKARLDSIDKLKRKYEEGLRAQKLLKINREFQNGIIALSERRYRDAISAFDATLVLDPENTQAKKYIIQAKEALRQIEEEVVDENSPYYNIVKSYIVSGKHLFGKGKYTESRKEWENILKLFPKNKIATEYILRCDLKLHPELFDKVSRRIINDGKELLKNKEYHSALSKFELIKAISEDYPGVDKLIALAKKGELPIKSAILTASDKKEAGRRYRLAMDYYKKGLASGDKATIRKALTELRWVMRKDPGNIKAITSVNKIESQLRIGSSQVAARKTKFTRKQLKRINKHYYQGLSYYTVPDYKKAISEWRKVLSIDPGHKKAKSNIRKCIKILRR